MIEDMILQTSKRRRKLLLHLQFLVYNFEIKVEMDFLFDFMAVFFNEMNDIKFMKS